MDFLRILFTIILFLNIPMAVASFIFAYILLRRAKGNAIYFNFGMAVLFLALWVANILLLFWSPLVINILSLFLTNLSFAFGILILHYFLIFTFHFPVSTLKARSKEIILYLLTLIILISIFLPGLYTKSVIFDFPFYYVFFNPLGLVVYTAYFFVLSLLAFVNLYKKYLRFDGVIRVNLKKILVSTFLAILFNFFLSLMVYFFISFNTTPFGALFTSLVLFYIYSILFSKKAI